MLLFICFLLFPFVLWLPRSTFDNKITPVEVVFKSEIDKANVKG